MNLEEQVCGQKLAQRLEELGVPQKSLFYWWKGNVVTDRELEGQTMSEDNKPISAFTVAELGEMLPAEITFGVRIHTFITEKQEDNTWRVVYGFWGLESVEVSFYAPTEASARAMMLIYLLENKLITL